MNHSMITFSQYFEFGTKKNSFLFPDMNNQNKLLMLKYYKKITLVNPNIVLKYANREEIEH